MSSFVAPSFLLYSTRFVSYSPSGNVMQCVTALKATGVAFHRYLSLPSAKYVSVRLANSLLIWLVVRLQISRLQTQCIIVAYYPVTRPRSEGLTKQCIPNSVHDYWIMIQTVLRRRRTSMKDSVGHTKIYAYSLETCNGMSDARTGMGTDMTDGQG